MSATTEKNGHGDHRDGFRKKPYSKPEIEDYGTVVELTGAGSGTDEDGGGAFTFSGAAG